MEAEQETTSNENTVDNEGNERLRSSNASSSSSTSSSEFQDPQLNSFKKGRNSNEEQNKAEKEPREPDGSTLQSPPIQTMERPDGSGSGSTYRIPSYVFARNKSGNPIEWSTTSNESLFSIHTGNTSFTGDKYSWLLEAADLYNLPEYEDSPETPETLTPKISSLQSPSSRNEVIAVSEKEEENVSTGDAIKPKASMVEDQATPASSRSNESGHSFAFPFPLAESQLDRGGSSVKSVKSVKSGLSSVPEKAEQKKDSPSTSSSSSSSSSTSSETNEEQAPLPEPEPEATNTSITSVVCNWFASCMACFSCRVKTTTDKDKNEEEEEEEDAATANKD